MILATISLLAYIVAKISASLFAGGVLLETLLGWDMWVGVPVIVAATGVYTIAGG